MKTKTFSKIAGVSLAATAVLASSAFAQKDPPSRADTREQRQQQLQNMTPEQRQQYFQQRQAERLKNMTPEQRAQWDARRAQMQQFQRQAQIASTSSDDLQKYLMQSAGVDDDATQNAILAFVTAQAEQRKAVTQAATTLRTSLGDKTVTPATLSTQLAALQSAAKDFRTWKTGALKDLDAKINYSTNPRLQSLLVLVGIIGDESTDAGGFNAIFPKGVAGSGDIIDLLPKTDNGPGGWGGGGFGGGGGRNGGNTTGGNTNGGNAGDGTVTAPPVATDAAPAAN